MRAYARAIVKRALLLVLALEALYVVAANLALNTPIVTRLFNRRPEKFHIGWTLAITPWPGLVHLTGVSTGGQSRAIQWEARLSSVTASFRPWPLRRRVVDLRSVRAAGLEYAQRPRLDAGEDPPPDASDWPAIAGLANPPRHAAPPPGTGQKRSPPWTVRADRIRCQVRQIWIGRYRLAGPAHVDATMSLEVRGPLELERLDYRLPAGDLWVGPEKMFGDLRLEAEARLAPFVPRGRKAVDVIRALSGDFELDSKDSSLSFLEIYFQKAPGLHLHGRGPMTLRTLLDAGRLLPGSRFERRSDRIDTTFLDSRFTGSGTIVGDVQVVDGVPTSCVEAVTGDFQVTRVGAVEAFAHGSGFRFVATSTSLELAEPFSNLHLTVDLPGAEIADLSVYNIYLPAKSRVAIRSGTGRIRYHFEGDSGERSLHGEMTLDMKDLALRFEDTTLRGDIRIDARLRRGEPRKKRFDIAGTRITLRHSDPPWKGAIRFPKATLTFTEPMRVDARIDLDLQDTRPIVVVFDAFKDVPPWIERLMTIEDVRGGAALRVGGDRVDVRELDVNGKGLRALADLSFGRRGRDGILYLRFHGLSLGVELTKGQKDFKLFRPRAWFERTRAERRRS